MKEELTADQKIKGICERTKRARRAAPQKWTQARMAKLLGVEWERYKKWETRTPIPHEYIDKFCDLTGIDEVWLIRGAEKKLPRKKTVDAI